MVSKTKHNVMAIRIPENLLVYFKKRSIVNHRTPSQELREIIFRLEAGEVLLAPPSLSALPATALDDVTEPKKKLFSFQLQPPQRSYLKDRARRHHRTVSQEVTEIFRLLSLGAAIGARGSQPAVSEAFGVYLNPVAVAPAEASSRRRGPGRPRKAASETSAATPSTDFVDVGEVAARFAHLKAPAGTPNGALHEDYYGVVWYEGSWSIVYRMPDGGRKFEGNYADPHDAAMVYDATIRTYYPAPAVIALNYPRSGDPREVEVADAEERGAVNFPLPDR